MSLRHQRGLPKASRTAAAVALSLCAAGCMTYRGPRGVEAAIERKAHVELRREMGFKLGPISTRIAVSLLHRYADEQDFRDLTGIGVAVFEVTHRTERPTQPITAADLGVAGWRTVVESRSDGEQLLVLTEPNQGGIHRMMFVSIESDEVVVARLVGDLDRLIAKTLAAADHDGARGARAAIGVGAD